VDKRVWEAIKWKKLRAQKSEELGDRAKLVEKIKELKPRVIATINRMTSEVMAKRKVSELERARIETTVARPAVVRMIANELALELSDVLGIKCDPLLDSDAGLFDGAPVLDLSKFGHCTLTKKHVEKYGERKCAGCGKIPELMTRVSWIKGRTELWHYECRPGASGIGANDTGGSSSDGGKKKAAERVYALAESHIAKHGAQKCIVCGVECMVGDRVAWKFGAKGIRHEECQKE